MVAVLVALSLLYWLGLGYAVERSRRSAGAPPAAGPRSSWPRLSIVVPARDEAREIHAALRSKLACGYPALEVVFVDDRSTDGTGDVARRLAAEDPRLLVVRVDQLPTGWLGKVHAMQRGLEASTGELVLFSDADVVISPGFLEKVVASVESERLDHATVVPLVRARGPLLSPALAAFFRFITLSGRMWLVSDPRSSAAMGVGAFNLVRRASLSATPGLEWLRMEIADDVALALLLKRHGFRSRLFHAGPDVSLEFYPSYRALCRAVEKSGATMPLPLLVLAQSMLVVMEGGFLAAGLSWATAAGFALAAVVSFRSATWHGVPTWPMWFPAAGQALLGFAMVRSGVLATRRGGVRWRDTFYSTAEVRAGSRVMELFRPGR
jgi:hypothetical protein